MQNIKFPIEELQSKLLPYNNPKRGEYLEVHQYSSRNIKIGVDEEIRCLDKKYIRIGSKNEVSNYGRIWVDGHMNYLKKGKGEYIIENRYVSEKVHRLVALVYCKQIYCNDHFYNLVVHHIDDNGFNNHYSNLLWVTDAQHTMIHLKGVWFRENDQLEFRGGKYCLKQQGLNQINGEFEMNSEVIWRKDAQGKDVKEVKYKIKFDIDKNISDFSGDIFSEIYINGNSLFNGNWKLL
jgi:hypothetical protein